MEAELKHSIAVVADGPTCTGFRLAGVQNVYPVEALSAAKSEKEMQAGAKPSPSSPSEDGVLSRREQTAAEEKIEALLSDEGTGIVIVNEKTMDAMDWRLKKKIERLAKPVIIAVPDKSGPMEQKGDSLRNMVKKALGFELMK